MAVENRLLTAALVVLAATTTAAQGSFERCGYMIEMPRPERPEFEDQNFDGMSWSQRPLVPAEDRMDVCMDMFSAGTQIIFMEEEIEGDVPIAKLNYQGTETPYVVSPLRIGSFSLLAPEIRKIPADTNTDAGDWHLVITNRQDYETPGMDYYLFEVRIPGESVAVLVALMIVNIDDNAPIIQMLAPCEIAETAETGVTTCTYEVHDADGEISTRFMEYTIDSDRGDEQVFELIRENIPNEWMKVNMVMILKQPLNYVANPLHIFRVTAWDSLPNRHEVTMMVEVENVEQRPPSWVEIFAVQQFDEKLRKSFRVRAIDADTGINKPMHYRLETEERDEGLFEIETIEGGHEGAWLHVGPIDRDALEREMFYVTIIAYKYGGNDVEGSSSFETPANIVIIINDVNDQKPLPLEKDGIYSISIMEETAMTLNLENFGFHDRDLGQNAQYTVHLESVHPEGAHEAFYIAPEVGYQRQNFIIGTLNHHMLDYEVPAFQEIQLKAIAIDREDNSLTGEATINIKLINWNDELPIFEHAVRTVSFAETQGAGFKVTTVLAEDLDIDDKVEHSLMGNAVDFLRIDKYTGDIFVTVDDAFNYHRQNELFIQVRADDTLGDGPYNTATSQLVIQLQDINNTPPTLRLPRGSPHVEENVPDGYLITEEVTATDPDTTAELIFEIDWESSYATKQGREAPANEFHKCVEIKTRYQDENRRGVAYGRVEVREIREGVTIDYEEFEVLYLTVRVRDINTVIGDDYDESTFTITIIDMNDNAPIWGEGQLEQEFRVREMSASGVVIGSLYATDIDGPLYNQVRYTIIPKEGTPDNLVTIDFHTGQITVQKNQAIDADEPPRFNLYYTVIASDKCSMEDLTQCPPDPTYHDTEGDIKIQIIDTNNKVPRLENIQFEVPIYEDSVTGFEFYELIASDLDRDLPNNNVSYQINYAVNLRIRDFFAVDLVTGWVRVEYTGSDVLDRDGDEPRRRIFFTIIDNFLGEGDGNRNQIDGEILVILLDVNDNAPELPDLPPWDISENTPQGVRLEPDIFAPDRDEPGTPNSLVAYRKLNLTTDRDIELPKLFDIITIEKEDGIDQTGELETLMDLKGYWGTYEIHIEAYDHGDPQQDSDKKYQIVVRPYNFHEPEFVFPKHGSVIRLSRERAVVSGILSVAGAEGAPLERLSATDEDGLHAGTVTFSIVGDDEAVNYFDVWNDGENSGTLTLKQALPEGMQIFEVTIRATDGGDEPGPKSSDSTVTVVFVPQGDPVFSPNTFSVAFVELERGLLERHELLEATDPKNALCYEDCYDIYYSIVDGNADGHFALDGNVLYLLRELNRDVAESHTLVVAASNTPGASTAQPASTLTVTVTVREANPRPHFERPLYTAGISTADDVDRQLLVVQATHTEGLPVTYSIDQESMIVDPSLETVRESAFEIDSVTGLLTLRIQPTASMHGMFEFDVVATDTNGATGHSAVKVYLISSRNRVYFLFFNELDLVNTHRDFIAQTFSNGFEMTCNIDQAVPATDSNGIPSETTTEVRAHFIRDDLPVPAEEITELRDDTQRLRMIQSTLLLGLLELSDVQAGASPVLPGGDNALAVYILAGLAGLLALLCLVLLITFIIRNRALNRRIAALSMTKYSSMDSGLNRAGLAAPGTNKHAVEGSNPIWNETVKAPDFDAISELSNDSDLIGIEDLPQFRNDYFPPDEERSTSTNVENPGEASRARNPVASHENNFGFNATPFSPEFANTQLRRT
uniref:CAD protein n=1 Tax=Sesamia inferens TaxID=492764 RepID=R4HHT6_SESIF|nr:CAD protein [Sesamia inferens]